MTIKEFKQFSQKELSCFESRHLDISVFLQTALKCDKTFILLNQDFKIPQEALNFLLDAVQKRKTGLPVSYITNHKEFFGYDFFVTKDVLIPKPDTEILVSKGIESIEEKINSSGEKILNVLDMCTGSGCVGLSVYKFLKEELKIPKNKMPRFFLSDISENALEIAKINAKNLLKSDFENIKFIQSNLFENLSGKFDVLLSNPPYVPKKMAKELLLDGRSEPLLALDGDVSLFGEESESEDGLEIIRNLILQSKEHLNPYAVIMLETGEYNALQTQEILKNYGFRNLKIHKDLENQFRVCEGIV